MTVPAPSTRPSRRWILTSPLAWLATGFGAGFSPIAPGTAGTAVGVLLFWPMAQLPFTWQAALTLALALIGVWGATLVARRESREDPGLVVVDEVVGIWVTLLLLPFSWKTALVGFFAFRLMDIVKPFPARRLEDLKEGWGIVADDVMAGIYANLVLQVLVRLGWLA